MISWINSTMILFESNPQYREKATIWHIFSLGPLYRCLAGGRVFRWFALNIPMDLGTGGTFTSDIDILARLYDYPRTSEWLYRAWEVKVSLLCKDGTARSLKVGKTQRTMTQLRAYRDFGIPAVSLLDVYLCEAGFMRTSGFPTPSVKNAIGAKIPELQREGFGYQLLPFEHEKHEGADAGLLTTGRPRKTDSENWSIPYASTINLFPPQRKKSADPFAHLADRLNDFFESSKKPSNNQIVFCRECRQLQMIRMTDEFECPSCHTDLVIQS